MEPIVYTDTHQGETTGSIYHERQGLSLFADTRARSVGDIISVILTESTQASKMQERLLAESRVSMSRHLPSSVGLILIFELTGLAGLHWNKASNPSPSFPAMARPINQIRSRARSLYR